MTATAADAERFDQLAATHDQIVPFFDACGCRRLD